MSGVFSIATFDGWGQINPALGTEKAETSSRTHQCSKKKTWTFQPLDTSKTQAPGFGSPPCGWVMGFPGAPSPEVGHLVAVSRINLPPSRQVIFPSSPFP